jgi:hypothetical protein
MAPLSPFGEATQISSPFSRILAHGNISLCPHFELKHAVTCRGLALRLRLDACVLHTLSVLHTLRRSSP